LVAAIKQEIGARSKEVFLPLEFEYGQTFEADWLEVVSISARISRRFIEI
jgi:hypothetical protein